MGNSAEEKCGRMQGFCRIPEAKGAGGFWNRELSQSFGRRKGIGLRNRCRAASRYLSLGRPPLMDSLLS